MINDHNTSEPRITDAELIPLIRAAGLQGAEALYNTYSKLILLVIIRIIPQPNLAEQALEATFIQVWNTVDDYIIEKERIYTWMIMIAKTLAYEVLLTKEI